MPHGHWRTTTFIAGLRQSGILAPLVLDGPLTGLAFRAYVSNPGRQETRLMSGFMWGGARSFTIARDCIIVTFCRQTGGWVNFEPTRGDPLAVFKTAAFNHSATHPRGPGCM